MSDTERQLNRLAGAARTRLPAARPAIRGPRGRALLPLAAIAVAHGVALGAPQGGGAGRSPTAGASVVATEGQPAGGAAALRHHPKSLLGVTVDAVIVGTPGADAPVRIDLVIRDTTGADDGVLVKLVAEAPARLVGDEQVRVRADAPWRGTVYLIVPGEGRWFLNYYTSGETRTHHVAGAASIPVVVGKPGGLAKRATGTTLKSTPAGERVMSVPSR